MTRWAIEDAENAVKGSFFVKLHEGVAHESLRYAEIRTAIGEKREISDKTLSRALARLVERGELRKRDDGAYEPVFNVERKDTLQIIAAADRLSIEAGAVVGMIGDQERGWTVYGIPKGKPHELRPKLRRAVIGLQEEIDHILRREATSIADKALRKARARGLSARDAASIRRILAGVFEFWETLRFEHLGAFAWALIMDRMAPGVLPEVVEKIFRVPSGVAEDLAAGIPPHKSMAKRPKEWIPYLSRIFTESEEELRDAWTEFLSEAEEAARGSELLRAYLTKRDWETFNRHWSSILAARYWLCAVIR